MQVLLTWAERKRRVENASEPRLRENSPGRGLGAGAEIALAQVPAMEAPRNGRDTYRTANQDPLHGRLRRGQPVAEFGVGVERRLPDTDASMNRAFLPSRELKRAGWKRSDYLMAITEDAKQQQSTMLFAYYDLRRFSNSAGFTLSRFEYILADPFPAPRARTLGILGAYETKYYPAHTVPLARSGASPIGRLADP
ncbi:hypothetical protein K438DRAFT_1791850 [Mycena galopus ATCC 62051]|nr:hypothetical protein K438DRAFT_1791850 [Mycena galopus ATCC 62051]